MLKVFMRSGALYAEVLEGDNEREKYLAYFVIDDLFSNETLIGKIISDIKKVRNQDCESEISYTGNAFHTYLHRDKVVLEVESSPDKFPQYAYSHGEFIGVLQAALDVLDTGATVIVNLNGQR